MNRILASLRLWLLVAMLAAGAVGLIGARVTIARIQYNQEEAADRIKDVQIARAIAAQVAEGLTGRQLQILQSALPFDQILIERGGRRVFSGPPITGSALEVKATSSFPGGQVTVRDYHSPAPGASSEVILVVAGWILLVIAAALGTTWMLTRALQVPIGRAVMAADRVAAGDLGARIGPVGPEEFVRLADAFDSMAARLEAADLEQREFLGDVAHEIATPVNSISGLAGALSDGTFESSDERRSAVAFIESETERLRSLLEDLRHLTTLDFAQAVRSEEVDMKDVLDAVATRFSASALQAQVSLTVVGESLLVCLDRRLLETVVDNFVANAIRYTPPEGGVSVRATQVSGAVVISVADTGIGIAADDMKRIFDRFYRTDPARHRATGGSGLGLALARRAAQALDARTEVSSEPGVGSEFRLVLPRSALREPPEPSAQLTTRTST